MTFYFIALVTVMLDQSSKWAAIHVAHSGPVFGELVRLTLTYNAGAAFGLFPGARGPFIFISGTAALGLMYANHVLPRFDRARRIPMALILGGTLGNLIDRVRTGRVTDFIDMGIGETRWPTYNVADIAVVVGAIALAVRIVFETVFEKRVTVEASAGESADAR